MSTLIYESESYIIRGGCFEVYKQFRNRHKEKIYSKALLVFLKKAGLKVEQEKQLPIFFDGEKVGVYIPDIVVNGKILVELKCKPFMTQDDMTQFWYYLKVTNFRLGFLINFGNNNGVEIIRRVYGK
ncbi:MAG: GxxExxY protein [Candidatus Taylorbacteria bacterium]